MQATTARREHATADPTGVFQALAETTRLRAVTLMARNGELCVCELTHALRVSQPKMSRHLAVLRDAGIVQVKRARQWSYYRIADGLDAWQRAVVDAAAAGVRDRPPFRDDQRMLTRTPGRPTDTCCNNEDEKQQ